MPCVYFERFCGTDSGLKGKQYNEEDEEEKTEIIANELQRNI